MKETKRSTIFCVKAVVLALALLLGTTATLTHAAPQTNPTFQLIHTENPLDISSLYDPDALADETLIGFYDEETLASSAIGLGDNDPEAPEEFTWEAAIRLTADELGAFAGFNLSAARFFHYNDLQHEGTLKIYSKGTATSPGTLLTSEPYTASAQEWVRVDLSTSVDIAEDSELWVSFEITSQNIALVDDYPMSVDGGPAVDGKGDWASLDGGETWLELQTIETAPGEFLDINWCIDAIVEGEAAELEIADISGGLGVTAVVNNIGQADAINAKATLKVTGGILNKIDVNETEEVATLPPGKSSELVVKSGVFFGLLSCDIEVTASADNAPEVSASKTATMFGPFVLNVK